MLLNLMYITNDPAVALIAERNGVDRIMVDLETLGKEERQRNMNTVKSHHSVNDINKVSKVLNKSEMLVRINHWNDKSIDEIEAVISAGAKRIMLPMWKTMNEVNSFFNAVNGRVKTTLLLETKEAVEILDDVLEHPMLDDIHIGLNDLHLSYGMTFLFEPLAYGIVDKICFKCQTKGVKFGFGGIARIGQGALPAERIVTEHYRLGSTMAILSRSFCNTEEISDYAEIEKIFHDGMKKLRDYEDTLTQLTSDELEENRENVKSVIESIVDIIKERRKQCILH